MPPREANEMSGFATANWRLLTSPPVPFDHPGQIWPESRIARWLDSLDSYAHKVMPHSMRHPHSLARKNGSLGKACKVVVRTLQAKHANEHEEYTLPVSHLALRTEHF